MPKLHTVSSEAHGKTPRNSLTVSSKNGAEMAVPSSRPAMQESGEEAIPAASLVRDYSKLYLGGIAEGHYTEF
jgi:hypothetical protein